MDQVDEVKQKVDIVSVIGERIELKKAGRNYKALCPFHSEKTPSFMVSPELQIFKCFGCGETGDVFSFLEKYEGMDFPEALKYLAEKVGVKLINISGKKASEKEKLVEICTLASRFYNYLLLNHPVGKGALNYLIKERGVKLESIKEFQLGFSPPEPSIFKKFFVEKKHYSPFDLEKGGIGIISGQDVFDRFRGRVIFPLFDHRGNVVGFAGRVLPGAPPDISKYVNSPETEIYHKGNLLYGLNTTRQFIKEKSTAIVVEGELDLISSWQAGIKNTVAIKGSALTEDQVRLLSRFGKKLILAMDADIAGDAAARRGISTAFNFGLEIKVARMGEFKDPDEAARKSPNEFKNSLIHSVNVWDFLIDSVFEKYDSKTGQGKASISQEVIPILKSISDSIVAAHYINMVSDKLGVTPEAVNEQIGKKEEKFLEEKEVVILVLKEEKKGRRQLLEERLLSLAFQGDPEILVSKNLGPLFSSPLTKRLFEEYVKYRKGGKSFSPSLFSETIPPELFDGFAKMVLKDTEGITEDPSEFEKEIWLVTHELKILEARHKLEIVGVKIRKFEEEKKTDKLKEAQGEFSKLSGKLSELESEEKGAIILQE